MRLVKTSLEANGKLLAQMGIKYDIRSETPQAMDTGSEMRSLLITSSIRVMSSYCILHEQRTPSSTPPASTALTLR